MCQISGIKCSNSTIRNIRAKISVIPANIFCQNTAWNDSQLLNAQCDLNWKRTSKVIYSRLILMQQYFICTIHFMLYWTIAKMLHYNILYLDEKYYLIQSLIMFSRHSASDSSRLHRFVSFDVWVNSFVVLKALFTEFWNCACAKRLLCLSEFVILVLH